MLTHQESNDLVYTNAPKPEERNKQSAGIGRHFLNCVMLILTVYTFDKFFSYKAHFTGGSYKLIHIWSHIKGV